MLSIISNLFYPPGKMYRKLYLFGLNGTVKHPDMQKIRIIGLFLENRLHWQSVVEKKVLLTDILGYLLFTNK